MPRPVRRRRGRAAALAVALCLVSAGCAGVHPAPRAVPTAEAGAPAPPSLPPSGLELIHVEANEGGSSGGHIGLAVDGVVYHFQSVDGLLLMERRSWESFRLRYSSLQNRPMHRLPIDLADAEIRAIRHALERRRLVQARHLELWQAFRDEREWLALQARGESPTLRVQGAGLFAQDADEPAVEAIALRQRIEASLGIGTLESFRREAEAAATQAVAESPAVDARSWRADRWPTTAGPETEMLHDRLAWREALDVLLAGRPVDPARQIDPLGAEGSGLSRAEREWLEDARRVLEDRIASLLRSPRPDRGRALLVAIARHRTASRSLLEDRFLTLDPIEEGAGEFDFRDGPARRAALSALARDFADAHRAARRELRGADARVPADRVWSWLEELAVRHFELAEADRDGRPIRRAASPSIPWPRGRVAAPRALAPRGIDEALRRADANLASVRAALDRLDGYRLLEHNCATELAVALTEPFGERAAEVLGGRLEPGAGLTYIPARLFDRAATLDRAGPVVDEPSYRQRWLARMRQQEHDGWVWLREGNTLTARAYGDSPHDGHFLFFTDGPRPWRPLGGALNLAYGVVQLGAGAFTWPFDGGRRIDRGARGAFYSLPEIVLWNIRKGRFEYTEEVRAHLVSEGP